MENLKNNIEDIKQDGENLVTNYLKLFGIRQAERLATFLGILSTVFLISTLILIVIVFGSFVLSDFLNHLFNSKYLGFLIVSIVYLVVIGSLFWKMGKTGRPLFTNLYIRFILPLIDVEIEQKPNKEGVAIEKRIIKDKINTDKKMLSAHTQMLKYAAFEDFLGTFLNLFHSKSKSSSEEKPSPEE